MSCHKFPIKNKIAINKIDIKLEEFKRNLDISSFYNAQFIPLELTKNSIIGQIDKIIVHDSLIYVLDIQKAKKLFVFNMQGKFIRSISERGKGNGEYLILTDFDIAEDKIYISSRGDNKMLIFNLNGQCIKDIKFSGFIGIHFKVFERNKVVTISADGSNKSAIFYDKNGKRSKVISNPGIDFMQYSNPFAFTEFNSNLYTYFAMNDTIYQLVDENLLPKYFIDFGENSIPYNKFKNRGMLENYLNSRQWLRLMNFFTFPKYHCIEIFDRKYFYTFLINKENGNAFYANILLYKDFPLYDLVGKTDNGPILLWGPPSHPLYMGIMKGKSNLIPKCFENEVSNANPGIVILTEK